MTLRYTVLLTRETEPDAVVATVPALDLVTYGATIVEARAAAEEAIALELIGRAKHGEPILAEPPRFASLTEIELRDISLDGVMGIDGFEAQIATSLANALGQEDGTLGVGVVGPGASRALASLSPEDAARLSQVFAEFAAVWHSLETELDQVFPLMILAATSCSKTLTVSFGLATQALRRSRPNLATRHHRDYNELVSDLMRRRM